MKTKKALLAGALSTVIIMLVLILQSSEAGTGKINVVNNSTCDIPVRLDGGEEIMVMSGDVHTFSGVSSGSHMVTFNVAGNCNVNNWGGPCSFDVYGDETKTIQLTGGDGFASLNMNCP